MANSVFTSFQLRSLPQVSAITGRRENKNGEDQKFSPIENVALFVLTPKYTEFESSSDDCGINHPYREATIF